MRRILEAALAVERLTHGAVGSSEAGAFRKGEKVVLAGGPYQGTPGIFLWLKADVRWADVTELNGNVRSHPVEWLSHPASVVPDFSNMVTEPPGAVS